MRGPLRWWIGAVAALVVIVLIGLAIRLVPDTPPESDHAVTEIQVLNLLRGGQSVGAYSRFGWSHPGPLYFEVLAPLYLVSGYRHLSVIVTVAIVNGACLIGLLAILRRYGRGHGLAITAAAVFAIYLVRMNGLLASSWNPHVGILPLALLLGCAAAAGAGHLWLLPAVIALASFVIQAHVGASLSVLAIVGVTVVSMAVERVWLRWRGRGSGAPMLRPMAAAIAVGILAWAPPLVDQIRPGGQHNLQHIYEFFRTSQPAAPRAADRAFERFYIAPFSSSLILWGDTPPSVREALPQRLASIEGGLLLVAAMVWWIARRRFEARLAILTAAAALAALLSIRRVPEYPKDYTILWMSVLGVMSWTMILSFVLGPVWSWIETRAPAVQRVLLAVLMPAALAAVGIACVSQAVDRRRSEVEPSAQIAELTRLVQARMDEAGTRAPLVHIPGAEWGPVTGVVLQLYRGSGRPTVDADWVSMFGNAFTPTGREPFAIAFAKQTDHSDALRYRSDYRLLGVVNQTYLYSVQPVPAAPFAQALAIGGSYGVRGDPTRLVNIDNGFAPPITALLTDDAMVVFGNAADFVTIAVPAGTFAGVRLSGQGATTWQLRCASDAAHFERAGRVTTAEGPGAQTGEAFLRPLAGCRSLKISPATETSPQWLSQVRLLVEAASPR